MSSRNDDQYYARREAQQRALAEKAVAPEIRRIHLDLADGYAARACSVMPRQTLRMAPSNSSNR